MTTHPYFLPIMFALLGILGSSVVWLGLWLRRERRACRESLARQDGTLRNALDAIITIDQHDRVLDFNPAAERMFGFAREEAVGREIAGLVIPHEVRGHHRAALARHIATGETRILDRRLELEALRKGGERFPVELSVTRISIDPPIFTAYLRDLGDRNAASLAMRSSEERFRAVVEQVRDYAIFTIDLDHRITSWNEGARTVLGYEESEFVGLPAAELFTPEDRAAGVPEDELHTAVATGRALDDRWMQRKGGERIFAMGSTTALRDEAGGLIGFCKIMRDQTPRKLRETELQATAEDSQVMVRQQQRFLAILSHELRNPLAPVRTAVEILRRDPNANPRLVEMIGRQVGHMTRLIDDLLDLSRIHSGKIELQLAPIDLREALDHAREIAESQCKAVRQELVCRLPDRPIAVRADAIRLAQVVGNLLHNACKFTQAGGRIELSAVAEDRQAVIRVRDNGPGIPPDKLSSIFGMFAQLGVAGQNKGGLGIGLHLARNLVELHEGTIEAFSDGEGRGTEFVVRLPLIYPQPEEAKSA